MHHIDTARFLFGEPASIYAKASRRNPHIVGEDRALIVIGHRNGVDGWVDGHRFLDMEPVRPVMGDAFFEGKGGSVQILPTGDVYMGGRLVWRWTCLPGLPRTPHGEPGCFDQVFLQFIKDSMAGRTPNVQSVGISYMYGGFWVPNKSHAMGTGDEFHVGPHIMIIGPDQKMLETLNHDGSNGEPYVNHLPGRTELYLVIPIREWDDAQAVRTVGAAHR